MAYSNSIDRYSLGLHKICNLLDSTFDTNRLVIKVASTWEGLQACRELAFCGIKTLATTVFTMEQAVLAGEVGCVSISPFIHEAKAHFDDK
jgi:transaldolase